MNHKEKVIELMDELEDANYGNEYEYAIELYKMILKYVPNDSVDNAVDDLIRIMKMNF